MTTPPRNAKGDKSAMEALLAGLSPSQREALRAQLNATANRESGQNGASKELDSENEPDLAGSVE